MTLRHFSAILAACLLVTPFLQIQAQEGQPPSPEAIAENEKFGKLVSEAQQFQAQSQLLDAMEKINEAEAIKPGTAILHNMRGSVYTAMRDFDKAQEQFEKAQVLHPGAFEPRFNLLELNYVRGQYTEAEKGFTELLNTYPKLRVEIRHITLFKILVSQLKQDKLTAAEETMKNFTFMDDTPAYYYARAAMSFHKKDKVDGHTWLNKGSQIFKQPEQTVPYVDSLIEARWIDSLGIPDELQK
ncbi:hypothetical protein FEM03_15730 [Phragmitibacter flavus]|uniref:Uncharacterized protein n=1 Tax=Phragmitibacter flavus TaxID=2576071 RepID=A0A5R8KBU0_9BACT|nr:hypothetical protein [Phragmitibacter flavus]TLD69774.1 hypothetical protein FEM03_15730 [Phragmitibacter flavus]